MPDNNLEIIGQKIRSMRQTLGLTQEQLGERADLHYSYIGQVERGDKIPSLRTLRKLAAALNTEMDRLLEETPAYETKTPPELWQQELMRLTRDRSAAEVELITSLARIILTYLDRQKE